MHASYPWLVPLGDLPIPPPHEAEQLWRRTGHESPPDGTKKGTGRTSTQGFRAGLLGFIAVIRTKLVKSPPHIAGKTTTNCA